MVPAFDGADLLVGDARADLFYFGSSAEEGATTQDFSRLEGYRIALNGTLFGLARAERGLLRRRRGTDTAIHQDPGYLFWDSDGTSAAGPVYLATLNGKSRPQLRRTSWCCGPLAGRCNLLPALKP